MRFSARIFATLALIFSILSATASAQQNIWRPQLYACINGSDNYADINLKEYLVKTGDAGLDAEIQGHVLALDSLFGVRVSVYFPNDGMTDASFTTEKHRTLMLRDDLNPDTPMTGTIFISKGLLLNEYRNYGSLMSLTGIVSHEYAHAMQAQYGFPYPKGLKREQHADFMAGWYTAYHCECRVQDPRAALDSIARKGDDRGYFDPDTHGTPAQRADAFMAGYNYFRQGGRDAARAYQHALGVVNSWGE